MLTKDKPEQAEDRAFKRCPLQARAEVRLESGVLLEGEVQDISMNGVMFATERSLPVGSRVRLCLVKGAGEHEHRIQSWGTVARLGDEGVAIQLKETDAAYLELVRELIGPGSTSLGTAGGLRPAP